MTKEEKQLLLIDLSARLPYGVIVNNEEGYDGHLNSINQTIFGIELGVNITAIRRADFQLDTCKPYLRPMSSMTNEEFARYDETRDWKYVDDDHYESFDTLETFDWLNAHHFDYRGLIEKGLALEAKDGMYKEE